MFLGNFSFHSHLLLVGGSSTPLKSNINVSQLGLLFPIEWTHATCSKPPTNTYMYTMYIYIYIIHVWATVNICYITLSHHFFMSVSLFFQVWVYQQMLSFFEECIIVFQAPAQFPKIKKSRILLSIKLNYLAVAHMRCMYITC